MAASASGKTELLAQFAEDYPKGPHDQPQSMCPAFGSSVSVCGCAAHDGTLGLSLLCLRFFTSHFYGAKRTVGRSIRFRVIGDRQLFEDIREAVHDLAEPETNDAVVVINLSFLPHRAYLDLLPKEINGVRIVGIDVPGFGVPT